jgi:hypothetical protein
MKAHHLKIRPDFFHSVKIREKDFEVRSTEDREFKVGD